MVRQAQRSATDSARPKSEVEPLRGQAEVLNRVDHVLAIMSGKGGVGKSSVAALLAASLCRSGKRVGLLDADITGPSIPRMFGLTRPPNMSPLGMVPPTTAGGIKVMSINLLLPSEDEPVIWRGPLIGATIKQFWTDVFWGDLHTLVIDLPPGTADAPLTVMQSIPLSGIVLVTSPQDLAGMVVRKAARMAGLLGRPILGLVENMAYARCPGCGTRIEVFGPSHAEQTSQRLSVPLLGRIPLDADLALRCDRGEIEQYRSQEVELVVEQLLVRVPKEKIKPMMGPSPERTQGHED